MLDFKQLCMIFEQVRNTKGINEKSKIIHNLFTNIRSNIKDNETYTLLRILLPKLDRERQSYNMKEPRMAKILIKMLSLPPGNDREVLSKSYLMAGQASDFGDVVYFVIRKYISNYKTTLTITELNKYLDDMANRSKESQAEDIFLKMFKKCSCEDARWLIRIVLKDLKLGIDSNRILNCYHKEGAAFFASNSNLRKVWETLYDESVNVNELDIKIFEAFQPMLSKRVDAATFKKELVDNKLFYVENKFDGERFQLHMENGKFMYFSRNGFNFTGTFGESYNTGILTPKLRSIFASNVRKVILDGEMMLWDKYNNKFGSKGMPLDVKKLQENGKYQPYFCVYDIILLNNDILTNRPLKDRVEILRKCIKNEIIGTILLSQYKEVNTQQEIIEELNAGVDNEEEGIIIKNPDSIYKYSDRNSGWYKMKLEFFQDVMSDLDLILLGGFYASSTSNTLNSFIVGIRSGSNTSGTPVYISFGKVASGLNDQQLEMLNKKLFSDGGKFTDFNSNDSTILFGKETPHYFIKPEKSLIFVVRATELIRTKDSSFKTPYTFRFPRVLNIRDDKPVQECLNMNELLELCKQNKYVIKLNKRHLDLNEILATKTRKMRKKEIVVKHFINTTKIADILQDYTIYVLNGTESKSKEDFDALIKRAGGKVSYRIDDNVDIILVGTYNSKVKELSSRNQHRYDVINVKWLERTIQDGNLVGYETNEVYSIGYSYKNALADEIDKYGDSYIQPATIESLKLCFEVIENSGQIKTNISSLVSINTRNSKNFNNFIAYFDKYKTVNDNKSELMYDSFIDELEFRYYNGTVKKLVDTEVNLIVHNGDFNRMENLRNYVRMNFTHKIEVVPRSFLYKTST